MTMGVQTLPDGCGIDPFRDIPPFCCSSSSIDKISMRRRFSVSNSVHFLFNNTFFIFTTRNACFSFLNFATQLISFELPIFNWLTQLDEWESICISIGIVRMKSTVATALIEIKRVDRRCQWKTLAIWTFEIKFRANNCK